MARRESDSNSSSSSGSTLRDDPGETPVPIPRRLPTLTPGYSSTPNPIPSLGLEETSNPGPSQTPVPRPRGATTSRPQHSPSPIPRVSPNRTAASASVSSVRGPMPRLRPRSTTCPASPRRPPIPSPRKRSSQRSQSASPSRNPIDVEEYPYNIGFTRKTSNAEKEGMKCSACNARITGLEREGCNYEAAFRDHKYYCRWYYKTATDNIATVIEGKTKNRLAEISKEAAMIRIMQRFQGEPRYCVNCFNMAHPQTFNRVASDLRGHALFVTPTLTLCTAAYNEIKAGEPCDVCNTLHSLEDPCNFPASPFSRHSRKRSHYSRERSQH